MSATDREIAAAIRHPLWRVAVGLLLLAVVVTAALGGFRKAQPARASQLPMLAPGQRVDSGLFQVGVAPGWTTRQMPSSAYPSERESYLIVPLQATNLADIDIAGAMKLREDLVWVQRDAQGQAQPVSPDVLLREDDAGFGVSLPPRVPVRLLAVWKRPPDAATPDSVHLGIVDRRFVEGALLTGESAWLQGDPAGQWRVPVRSRIAPAAERTR